MKSKSLLPQFRIFVAATFVAASSAHAATQTWHDANADNTWNTTNLNWDGGLAAWTNGNDAIFGGTGEAITIGAGTQAHNLTFNSTGYSITGTTTLTGAGATVTTNSDASLNTVGGTVGLTKSGAGSLTLTGTGTHAYTGLTSVNEGQLIVKGGLASTSAFVDSGATLRFDRSVAGSITWNGALTGTGAVEVNAVSSSAMSMGGDNSAFAGTVKVLTGSRLNISGANASSANAAYVLEGTGILAAAVDGTYNLGSLSGASGTFGTGGTIAATFKIGALDTDTTFSGVVSGGSMSLEKVGTGTFTIAGTNVYTGKTTVTAGTLRLAKSASLAAANWTAAKVTVASGATLALNVGGTNEFTSGNVDTLLTAISVAGAGTGLQAGAKIGFDTTTATGGTFTQGNLIANSTGANGGAIGVTKLGTGTLVFDNVNTYTGDTTVAAGTLQLLDDAGLAFTIGANGVNNQINGTGTLLLDGNLTFDLAAAGTTLGDTWQIVDNTTLAETYSSTFSVVGFTDDGDNTWSFDNAGTIYDFSENTGALTVIPEPAAAVLGSLGLLALLRRRRA